MAPPIPIIVNCLLRSLRCNRFGDGDSAMSAPYWLARYSAIAATTASRSDSTL